MRLRAIRSARRGMRLTWGIPLALAAAAVPALAQQPADCARLTDSVRAALTAPDGNVTVYATIRPAYGAPDVPRWYLNTALQEIASRFDAKGMSYDPLVDVTLPVTMKKTGDVAVTAGYLADREVVVTSLKHASSFHLDVEAPHMRADAASATARLAGAAVAAASAGALPPPPESTGDSLRLVLRLRPALHTPDTIGVWVPLFRAAGLHATRAQHELYASEADVRPLAKPMQRMPVWPSGVPERSGLVLLRLDVSASGKPDRDSIVPVLATPHFLEPAKRAVEGWRFTPATVAGCPVQAMMGKVVIFNSAD